MYIICLKRVLSLFFFYSLSNANRGLCINIHWMWFASHEREYGASQLRGQKNNSDAVGSWWKTRGTSLALNSHDTQVHIKACPLGSRMELKGLYKECGI